MDVTQNRSKNKIVTHIRGFHAVYPATSVFERHRSICDRHVISREVVNWASLFPNEGGYNTSDWDVTVIRRPHKARVVFKKQSPKRPSGKKK